MKELRAGRVLVVEDDKQLGDLYVQALGASGYEVELAANGRQALSMYAEALEGGAPYHVVIMDLNMPDMNGQDTLDNLLGLDGEVNVIVATGSDLEPEIADALAFKTTALIFKPFSLTSLYSVVSEAVA